MTLYYESELKHYGIPGMKWGHRKAKAMAANVSRQIEGNSNSATRKKAQKINASRSIPSKIGTFVLTGWGGNRTYNTGQATGRGKIKSGAYALGASVVGSTLGSSFGNVVASSLTKNPKIRNAITTGSTVAGAILANRLVSNELEDRNDARLSKKRKTN